MWLWYLLTWFVAAFFIGTTSLAGCGLMLLLLLPVPLLVRFDRWNRRRQAWNRLADAQPHDDNGRVHWLNVHEDLGLVHRDANGKRRIVARGVVYFSYDPWTDRVDTGFRAE